MSLIKTIKEYVELVRKGIANKDDIIDALVTGAAVKNGEVNEEDLAEILRRKDICASCPFNSAIGIANGTYRSNLPFQHCQLCQCRIGGEDTKEYCLSCNCGAEAYNKMYPHLPALEVRWRATRERNNTEQ
jgi:hypothetical protein